MSQGDRRVPRAIHNAETGRYAHACPDLDQEFPMEDCQGEQLVRCHTCHDDHKLNEDCPKGARNTYTPAGTREADLVASGIAGARKDETAALLSERGETHGDYSDHARATMELKRVLQREIRARGYRYQPPLTNEQEEALAMILHKIGRIVAGRADFKDHWDDIAGYARLVSDRCHDAKTA